MALGDPNTRTAAREWLAWESRERVQRRSESRAKILVLGRRRRPSRLAFDTVRQEKEKEKKCFLAGGIRAFVVDSPTPPWRAYVSS